MKCGERGAVLVETCLLVAYLVIPLFFLHLEIIKELNARQTALQERRLKYDGKIKWRPRTQNFGNG